MVASSDTVGKGSSKSKYLLFLAVSVDALNTIRPMISELLSQR